MSGFEFRYETARSQQAAPDGDKNKKLMRQPTITTVKEYNDDQQRQYEEHLAKCKANGVQEVDPFNRYFHKFPYKTGYVLWGKYAIYKKRKKDLIFLIT